MRRGLVFSALALAALLASPANADEKKLGIADVVRAVRAELAAAQAERVARGEEFLFATTELELELSFTVSREAGAEGGVSFWIVEAGASGKVASAEVQKIKLKFETGIDPQKLREGQTVDAAPMLGDEFGKPAYWGLPYYMPEGGAKVGAKAKEQDSPLGGLLVGPPQFPGIPEEESDPLGGFLKESPEPLGASPTR